jgi:hypothetical protein
MLASNPIKVQVHAFWQVSAPKLKLDNGHSQRRQLPKEYKMKTEIAAVKVQ